MLTLEHWTRRLFERVVPTIRSYAQESAQRLWRRLFPASPEAPAAPLIDTRLPAVHDHVNDAVDRLTLSFCEETNATTSLQLSEALHQTREAIREGVVDSALSMDDLTKRVNQIFDQAEEWRAKRIAVTESSRAVHMGQMLAAQESGRVKALKWLASDDACPLCQELADKGEVPLGTPFVTGTSDNPVYADVYHPPRHPNCQCSLLEIGR